VADIVIPFEENLKPLEAPIRALLEGASRQVAKVTGNGRAVDYARVEVQVAQLVAAIETAAHQVILQAADVDEPVVQIEGVLHRRVMRSPGTYRTLAGAVTVERSLYRPAAQRNAPTVDPVSMRVGALGQGWLPATAAAMAHAVQMGTSREAEAQARHQRRLPYSRSAFEDVGHLVGQQYCALRTDIEEALIESLVVPAEATSVSASIDRVSIPMEEARVRPVGRPRKGAARRPVARVFRMGYCGTVTLHDKDGKALLTLRYGRMPGEEARELASSLAADTKALLTQRPDLAVVALADGAPEMWNLLVADLNPSFLGVEVLELIDYWHVAEKLGAAARALPGRADARLDRWKMLLLNRKDAPGIIRTELLKSGREWQLVGDQHPVHDAIVYLENNGARMGYTTARRRGLPIGSGAVEATCKTLVEVRMRRAGSRWKKQTGEHILQLRALAQSDRYDPAIQMALAPLRKAVRKVAA
jgi:hypothetical protein